MTSVALAIALGIAVAPVVLIFGPVYFPWSLLVVTSVGAIVGLTIAGGEARRTLVHATGLAALMLVVAGGALVISSSIGLGLGLLVGATYWLIWVFFPLLVGSLFGSRLRTQFGLARAAAIAASVGTVVLLLGAALAMLAAPPEVAGLAACESDFMCPRTQYQYIAERRRLFAVERVVAFDGRNATCTYTAWGGVEVGRAEVQLDRGSQSWIDGAWPRIVSFPWR